MPEMNLNVAANGWNTILSARHGRHAATQSCREAWHVYQAEPDGECVGFGAQAAVRHHGYSVQKHWQGMQRGALAGAYSAGGDDSACF